MEIKYRCNREIIDYMINETKDVEIRLLNGKSTYIRPHDFINFIDFLDEEHQVKVEVVNKNDYNNLTELLNDYDINRILPNQTKEDLDNLLKEIFMDNYPNSKLVAIEFKKV